MRHEMMRYLHLYALLIGAFVTSCKSQNKTELPKGDNTLTSNEAIPYTGPTSISRNIIQDKKGNLWIASWQGVFRYDGKSFTNFTSEVSTGRFFSLLQDRNGHLWFGAIGDGVYYFDGNAFRHFTTKDGLLNNDVVSIYEDKKGNIWFGVFGGTSRYDGKSFRNYILKENTIKEDQTGITFTERPPYEVNAMIEDNAGKFWFATRGNTFVYDGQTSSVFTHHGKPFTNVRSVIEDRKGNIWLGGSDGLWRYDGNSISQLTPKFTGYIYEDSKGNIWTSSEGVTNQTWALSRYDEKTLTDKDPIVNVIKSEENMFFGITEAHDGSIWCGSAKGVHRYDGKTFTDLSDDAGQ